MLHARARTHLTRYNGQSRVVVERNFVLVSIQTQTQFFPSYPRALNTLTTGSPVPICSTIRPRTSLLPFSPVLARWYCLSAALLRGWPLPPPRPPAPPPPLWPAAVDPCRRSGRAPWQWQQRPARPARAHAGMCHTSRCRVSTAWVALPWHSEEWVLPHGRTCT